MGSRAAGLRHRVRIWDSLITRLLVMSMTVCVVSVTATAWLVVRSTETAIEQVTGQNLRDDAIVYDALLDWARSHRGWDTVGPELDQLSDQTGYRILLTDIHGNLLADSEQTDPTAPAPSVDLTTTRAIIDPGQVDWSLLQHAPEHSPAPQPSPTTFPPPSAEPVPAPGQTPDATPAAEHTATGAPAARLFITGRQPAATSFVDLSAPNRTRIILISALVLAVAALLSVVGGLRITRPLRELSRTAQRMREGDDGARADIRTQDEIGQVAATFNSLALRRREQERLRRAMVSDIAHELRSPLSTVRGWLEAAQDRVVPLDDQLVNSLHEEALHLQRLVTDLQDLALGDAGELRLHRQQADLSALLEQLSTGHDAAATTKAVTLTRRITPGLVIDADPVRLRQAVNNLLTNAIRHTPAGGTVTLTARTAEHGSLHTVIEVRDTGEGISEDDLPHVFQRFWRADRSRTRETGGTGLGLAIVRQIVQAHGGSVQAQSTPGSGSAFTISLP